MVFCKKIYKECVQKWIERNNIQPKFKINDIVKFEYHIKIFTGTINKIDNIEGKYYIFCKDLGHVECGSGTRALVIDWENIEKIN